MALGGTLEEEEVAPAKPSKTHEDSKEPPAPKKELTEEQKKAEEFKQQGNALYKQRKFHEALQAYDEAIKHDHNEILYLNNKAGTAPDDAHFLSIQAPAMCNTETPR